MAFGTVSLFKEWDAITDKFRHLKTITVFAGAMLLSLIHEHFFFTLYPLVMCVATALLWNSSKWNIDRYCKLPFYLTMAHTLTHYFLDSYFDRRDAFMLEVDMFIHWCYAVVAVFHFRAKREMLSKDPLMKFFNGVAKWVWIPAGLGALYLGCFHTMSPLFYNYLNILGGYALSTGTAMVYCNVDLLSSQEPNSVRGDKVKHKGITSHGVQIFCAFLFAILYIEFSRNKIWMADKLEHDWDYASHLYVCYAIL